MCLHHISVSGLSAALIKVSARLSGGVGNGVLGNKTLYLDERIASGEIKSALVVNRKNLNDYLIADIYDILNLFGSLDIKLADVYKSLLAGGDLNKCAE